jgi:hypothetical protein
VVAALLGLVSCQGRRVPPPPPAVVGPAAIPDSQPAVDAPLFVGQNAFAAPLATQAHYTPALATARADGGNSGVTDGPAPLGRGPVTGSAALTLRPPLLWDSSGDLTAGCHVQLAAGLGADCLAAVTASSLTVQARWLPPGQDLNLATAVVDASERIIVTSRQGHLFVVSRPDTGGSGFDVLRDVDLSGHLAPGQGLLAAIPDDSGNLWFVTGGPPAPAGSAATGGSTVGYVRVDNQVVTTTLAGQTTETGFAVDQDTVYLATAPAGTGASGSVYALTASAGQLQTVWREAYDAGTAGKPGALTRGTAASVVLLGSQYLALTDNADDQAHLLVFFRGVQPPARSAPTTSTTATGAGATTTGPVAATTTTTTAPGATTTTAATTTTTGPPATTGTVPPAALGTPADPRLACRVPLFAPGASAVESAVIGYSSGTTNSVIVANGFDAPPPLADPSNGGPDNSIDGMAPGVSRVDVAPDGSGCQTVWTAPLRLKSSPVLAGATGLVYGYTQDESRASNGTYIWYFVAVDYRNGRVVWQQRAGAGSTKNDNRQPMILGPNGVLYQTVPLGLVWMRDVANRP